MKPATPAVKGPDSKAWERFLSRHDPTWTRITDAWDQGAFIGNGMLGAMIYKETPTALRWELGRCDVLAHFQFPMVDWADPRVPIGDLILETAGTITSEAMRLDLWNAEVRGRTVTDVGTLEWRSVAHAEEMVFLVEVTGSDGEAAASVRFRPRHGVSPCLAYPSARAKLDEDYLRDHLPPLPEQGERDGVNLSVQAFLTGGECAVAWREVCVSPARRVLVVSITNSYPQRTAVAEAVAHVNRACREGVEALIASHRRWWHAYYPASFVSLSDTYWEGFYWIQMYKLAAATRADRALIDSQGPWLTQTPWPTCVWNLNVQLSYSPVYTANRLALGESLCRTLDRNLTQLMLNVPDPCRGDSAGIGRSSSCVDLASRTSVGWEVGNLTWVCHNYYRQYRATMDDAMLRERLYPLLRRAINFYLHILEEGDDGRLHLPPTHSPEYGRSLTTRDANYDLALLRWGCRVLIDSVECLGVADERATRWRDVLDRLVDPPVDQNGLRVGRDLAFDRSHRHYSHLLAIYPLRLLTAGTPADRELIERSLHHWQSLDAELQGYSFTGAASIRAALGDGNGALVSLDGLRQFLQPNTMYRENGPVIETPLAAAESVHDMLLQSWGGVIRVFPAVPNAWPSLVFHHLRAEGAFLVSAERRDGTTCWVQVTSLAGEPCRLALPAFKRLAVRTGQARGREPDGTWRVDLPQGDTVLFALPGEKPDTVAAREADPAFTNFFGMAVVDNAGTARGAH